MPYDKKPKMILFDVGGTLFDDGKCDPVKGFEKLRLAALNPEVTTAEKLGEYWDSFMNDVSDLTSREGIILDIPLSAVIRYATMNTGLHFDIPMAEQEEIFDRFNSSRRVIDGVPELLEGDDHKYPAKADALTQGLDTWVIIVICVGGAVVLAGAATGIMRTAPSLTMRKQMGVTFTPPPAPPPKASLFLV